MHKHTIARLLSSFRPLRALLGAAALLACTAAYGQIAVNITVNTSGLIAKSSGPFYLDFQLNDGSGTGNGNNTVTLSHFNFVSGGALGSPSAFGGVTGNLSSTITLKDTSPFNEFYQAFTPGSFLTFTLSSTTAFTGLIPDLFSFAILDSTLSNLPTLSPGASDAFALVNLTGPGAVVMTYAENNAIPPVAGGPALGLPAPTVTPVPEPSTYGLAGAAVLVGIIAWSRRRKSLVRVSA